MYSVLLTQAPISLLAVATYLEYAKGNFGSQESFVDKRMDCPMGYGHPMFSGMECKELVVRV